MKEAIAVAGHTKHIQIGMDVAASEFFVENTKKYDLNFKDAELSKKVPHITSADLVKIY